MSLCLLVLHVAYQGPRLNPLVKDLQAAGRIRHTIRPLLLSRSLLHPGPEREARPDLRSQGQSNQTQPCSCLSASQSCEKLFLEPSADTNPEGWRASLLSWSHSTQSSGALGTSPLGRRQPWDSQQASRWCDCSSSPSLPHTGRGAHIQFILASLQQLW